MKAPEPVHFLGCSGTASCDQGVIGTSLLRSALDVAQYTNALMESDSNNGLVDGTRNQKADQSWSCAECL